jgi:ABC-type branched-subunit amino acid transport system permease subunit
MHHTLLIVVLMAVVTSAPAAFVVIMVVVVITNVKLTLTTLMAAEICPVCLTKAKQSRSHSQVISNAFSMLLPVQFYD